MSDDRGFDALLLLARRWRTIVLCSFLGAAGGAAYALLATDWYSATLTVVQAQRARNDLSSLTARLPEGLDAVSQDVQRIDAVLTSNSVSDDVIEKFKLKERYGTEHLEHARATLWSHCSTWVERRSGVVSLSCEDTDPKFVMDMTAYFGEVGNRVFGRVSASSAREERRFLEAQVVKARDDVDGASKKLREFQEQNKIVDLPEQSKAVISAMASIEGELLSKQLELSYLTSFSSRSEASVVQLQQQIEVMGSKLKQLEESQETSMPVATAAGSGDGSARKADFFPGAMSVPNLRYELEQLLRDQKLKETVFLLMTQRFEMAKVDEARDTSTFQILDYPTLPTYRARPHRKQVALFGLALGIALAITFIVVPEWWKRRFVVNR